MSEPSRTSAPSRASFRFRGDFVSAEPYGSGHINDTYCVIFEQAGSPRPRFISPAHQPQHLQATRRAHGEHPARHRAPRPRSRPEPDRAAARVAHARFPPATAVPGTAMRRATTGAPTASSKTPAPTTPSNPRGAGLSRPPAPSATSKAARRPARAASARHHPRLPPHPETLRRSCSKPSPQMSQAAQVTRKAEIDFALRASCRSLSVLLSADLPERVTHNDTKFNNVMLDDTTGEGICVIDLDTVMPGLALYDFGDMVRTTTSPAAGRRARSAQSHDAVPHVRSAGARLSRRRRAVSSPPQKKLIWPSPASSSPSRIGIRFLTDYLAGDTYFKIHREGHNLDRCRTQFKLLESIESQQKAMDQLIRSI